MIMYKSDLWGVPYPKPITPPEPQSEATNYKVQPPPLLTNL